MVTPYIHHNIYLSSNSVIHTIKYGSHIEQNDWYSSPQLDEQTKFLDPRGLVST